MKYMAVKSGMKVRVKPDLKTNKEKYRYISCGWVDDLMDYAGKSVTVSEIYGHTNPACFEILEDGGIFCWSSDLVESLGDFIEPLF